MINTIIYQIGRLDIGFYKELEFQVDGKVFKTSLSSFAIRDFFARDSNNTSIVLIYPVSLPFNTFLLKNQSFTSSITSAFKENIENALNKPEEYLNNPHPLFATHPHSKEVDDFFVIHSLGTYSTEKQQISFSCYYSDIFLEILFDMVGRYLKHMEKDGSEFIRFIIDISSGHNIYISALLEAARQFGVCLQLAGWHNREKIPEIVLAFSDPILPNENIKYAIHFDTLKTKALFSSPVDNRDVEGHTLSRKIFPDLRENKRKLQKILDTFLITYSAIKNNTPLAIYQFGYDEKDTILAVLKIFIENTKNKLYASFAASPDLKKDEYLKTLLAISFYYGITCMLERYNIHNSGDSGTDINSLRTSFEKIYEVFGLGLNNVILGNEVEKQKKALEQNTDENTEEWKSLFCLLTINGDKKETSPQKRNFFAHAGFEQNITQYRIENGSLKLRYKDEQTDTIKRWLKESA